MFKEGLFKNCFFEVLTSLIPVSFCSVLERECFQRKHIIGRVLKNKNKDTVFHIRLPWASMLSNVNKNRTLWLWGGVGGRGALVFSSSNLTFCFLSPRVASESKPWLNMCRVFLAPGPVSLADIFSRWEAGSRLWAAHFRLLPTGSHKADIPLCWAKRMLESEARVSGASRPAALAALLPLSSHTGLPLHFSEINKSSRSYVSLRLRREPLIKQLSCWSEVTLILGLHERKPNGAVFMLTIQSSAQPVGPAVAWARKAHSVSSREARG